MEQYLDTEKQTVDEFEADLEKRVRDAVAAQFVLDQVAKKEEIAVNEGELQEHLMRRAQQSGQNPQEFIPHMLEHNHIPEMVAEVVRGKALAQIVESATVTDESGNHVELKLLMPDGTIGEPTPEATRPRSTRRRRPSPTRPPTLGGEGRRLTRTRSSSQPSALPAGGCVVFRDVRHAGRVVDLLRVRRRDSLVDDHRTRGRSCAHRPTAPRIGVLGAAALGAQLADELVLGTVRDVHGAVSRRVRRVLGRATGLPATPSRRGPGRSPGWSTPRSGRAWASPRRPSGPPTAGGVGSRLEESTSGRFTLAAINGLIGDRLADDHPDLAITMAVRAAGRDVPLERAALAAAYPTATADVVVFLHGLAESDDSWRRGGRGGYADRLAAEGTWTPVVLRANTGLPIADNGVALASLLDDLVACWPVPVRRIALVGHSMGGLVMRSACAVVTDAPKPLAGAGDQRGHAGHAAPRRSARAQRPRRCAPAGASTRVGALRPDPRVPVGRDP